jgi:hypothetical protein
VRRISLLTPVLIASLGVMPHQPVLNADSLYDLHDSADRVALRMDLSSREFASLEHALDVMVGDRARRLLEKIESSPRRLPACVRLAAEARVLAPVHGMTYDGVVSAAVEKTLDRRTGLLGDLRAQRASAPVQRRQLQKIDVIDSTYWSEVTTGERAIDFTIYNGSDETVSSLVLDCRLIDTDRRQTRERGTCRVEFSASLPAGETATATASVGWHTRQRLGWLIEAKPIRAYDAAGDALWGVASEIDPADGGPIDEIETRIADLDHDLDLLRAGS